MDAALPVYDSSRSSLRFVEEARELWAYRHFVYELAARDIKVRYKRSVIGVAWTMLSPLMTMIVFTLVFSTFQRLAIPGYPVYYLSAAIYWTFFSQVTSHVGSLTTDALEIANRIYVPRSVFVASAVAVGLVNLLLSLVPFAFIVLVTGRPAHWTWFFLPVSLVIGTLFAAGAALVVFTLALRFVDVRDMYQAFLTPWFFVTPIVYEPSLVPPAWRWVVRYNPMTYLVEIFRAPLYHGWLPGANTLAFAVLAAVSSLAAGWLFYAWKVEEYGLRA
jgi:ABC-type polysaccharide/polyol phosphate export permease